MFKQGSKLVNSVKILGEGNRHTRWIFCFDTNFTSRSSLQLLYAQTQVFYHVSLIICGIKQENKYELSSYQGL